MHVDGGVVQAVGAYGAFRISQGVDYTIMAKGSIPIAGDVGAMIFQAAYAVPTAHENRPASISHYACITY